MQQDFDSTTLINRDKLRALMTKSDHPAILKLTVQLGLFVTCLYLLGTLNPPLYILMPLLLCFGFVIFSLYAPFHETTHGTAFKTALLNDVGAWLTGIIYGYSPGMHKGFHFEHHRYTNQERDPEKGFSLPPMPARTCCQIILAGVLGVCVPAHSLILSFVPTHKWDRFEAAWAPRAKRQTLQWECRLVSVIWIVAFYLLSYHLTLMLYLLIGLFLGRFIHGFITVVEHEGLASEGHMLYRSRSVVSHPIYRWFWWNMNYHAEHHTWPAVPFHQLPELHRLASQHGMLVERGYMEYLVKDLA